MTKTRSHEDEEKLMAAACSPIPPLELTRTLIDHIVRSANALARRQRRIAAEYAAQKETDERAL